MAVSSRQDLVLVVGTLLFFIFSSPAEQTSHGLDSSLAVVVLLSLPQGLVSLMLGVSVSERMSPLGLFQTFPCLCPLPLPVPLLTSALPLALSPKPCRAKAPGKHLQS